MIHLLLAIIYLSFISLGLPDSLLGAAWPSVYRDFCVPISYAGIISMIIAAGTVISSLQSDRLTKKFGTGLVTTASVAMTAVALLGFSASHSFWQLCLWAVPYGLGAGSVDASLNNYVALHFASRHMSWLHCMWGIGASVGPYIMGRTLSGGYGWNTGYCLIAVLQLVLTGILLAGLPLWKKATTPSPREAGTEEKKALTLGDILKLPGAKEVMAAFFCYSAIEQTTGLWASSYLTLEKGISAEAAAGCASLFFIGITVGRALGGFLTMRFDDTQMIRLGQGIIAFGVMILLIPSGELLSRIGLILIGLGCAPIYPCIIHSTPSHFGADRSQAVIGVQMASAYVGTSLMPPLFGILASAFGTELFPVYLSVVLILMIFMHERLLKKA